MSVFSSAIKPDASLPSLSQAARELREGSLSAREYAERLLARVRERDAEVRAWAALDEAHTLELAAACDTARAVTTLGPLHGLPIGVKDIFDTGDWPTQFGSPVYAGRRPSHDAAVVARLKAAGAYVFGKTVTTEFAFLHPGKTRNPWNTDHTPGGSSSGSAAAVAAGMVPGAIGTQTNGSVIRPAAFCGVVGFKPGFGLIPYTGGLQFSATLDQVGTFTANVRDAALLAAHLAEGEAIAPEIAPAASPPRIAVIRDYPWTKADPDAAAHFDAVLTRLEAAGAQVRPLALPGTFRDANLVLCTIMFHEAAREHGTRQDEHRARFSAVLNAALDEGRGITDAAYRKALVQRAVLIEQALDWFEECDAVASLPAPGIAPARLDITGDPSYCTLWSLTGFPAMVLPSGFSVAGLQGNTTAPGLPYGLQLAACAGGDNRLLAVALWCEGALAA